MGYVFLIIAIFIIFVVLRSVRIIPQARKAVVERLGRYPRPRHPGLRLDVPCTRCCNPLIDLHEHMVHVPPPPAHPPVWSVGN